MPAGAMAASVGVVATTGALTGAAIDEGEARVSGGSCGAGGEVAAVEAAEDPGVRGEGDTADVAARTDDMSCACALVSPLARSETGPKSHSICCGPIRKGQ